MQSEWLKWGLGGLQKRGNVIRLRAWGTFYKAELIWNVSGRMTMWVLFKLRWSEEYLDNTVFETKPFTVSPSGICTKSHIILQDHFFSIGKPLHWEGEHSAWIGRISRILHFEFNQKVIYRNLVLSTRLCFSSASVFSGSSQFKQRGIWIRRSILGCSRAVRQ